MVSRTGQGDFLGQIGAMEAEAFGQRRITADGRKGLEV